MHIFDDAKRSEFFDRTFAPTQKDLLDKGTITHLHPRDMILLNSLERLPKNLKVLDYGCGQGRLLGELLSRGYDAWGYEPSTGMAEIATEHFLGDRADRLLIGDANVLSAIDGQRFDVVLLMGVMQYLSPEERIELFARCKGYLAAGGKLIVTFQNGLFDLFTFNKYTADAVANMILQGLVSPEESEKVERAIGSLLVKPEMPPHSDWRARDNIYVALDNPLTIGQLLADNGFSLDARYFYEWFGLPPLLTNSEPEIAARIKQRFEVEDATDWRGHFLANAMLIEARPI